MFLWFKISFRLSPKFISFSIVYLYINYYVKKVTKMLDIASFSTYNLLIILFEVQNGRKTKM